MDPDIEMLIRVNAHSRFTRQNRTWQKRVNSGTKKHQRTTGLQQLGYFAATSTSTETTVVTHLHLYLHVVVVVVGVVVVVVVVDVGVVVGMAVAVAVAVFRVRGK